MILLLASLCKKYNKIKTTKLYFVMFWSVTYKMLLFPMISKLLPISDRKCDGRFFYRTLCIFISFALFFFYFFYFFFLVGGFVCILYCSHNFSLISSISFITFYNKMHFFSFNIFSFTIKWNMLSLCTQTIKLNKTKYLLVFTILFSK